MAPFNLENNIREKLENRELNPSPDAWKKLEAQLDNQQPKKKSMGWYYLAASVAGILILSSVFLNKNTIEVENAIVKENVQQEKNIEIETQVVSEIATSSEDKVISEETKSETTSKKVSKNVKPNPPQKESAIDKKIKKSEALAGVPKDETPVTEEVNIINVKVDEVVASIKSLQKNNEEVTIAEVETLLNNARRDIQTQRILSNPQVDATALLQEVEWELEKSFRDKVFDALGEGFNKIRTAVSQRND